MGHERRPRVNATAPGAPIRKIRGGHGFENVGGRLEPIPNCAEPTSSLRAGVSFGRNRCRLCERLSLRRVDPRGPFVDVDLRSRHFHRRNQCFQWLAAPFPSRLTPRRGEAHPSVSRGNFYCFVMFVSGFGATEIVPGAQCGVQRDVDRGRARRGHRSTTTISTHGTCSSEAKINTRPLRKLDCFVASLLAMTIQAIGIRSKRPSRRRPSAFWDKRIKTSN